METEPLYDKADPDPSALVESLRAFGYSMRTAIADLIDNCITAEARNVWITFEWDGSDSRILIRDDGKGMSEARLIDAMRPGSEGPLIQRAPHDLGRFGLGLKTASFSQCRRLTVLTRQKNGPATARCWDLDYVSQKKEWRLLKTIEPDPAVFIDKPLDGQGTIVLWQKLDRIVGQVKSDDNKAYSRFLEAIDKVKQHLAMVFHRFLERPNSMKIWVNGGQISPWDPFLRKQKATQELPPESLPCGYGVLHVVPFVLPHRSKIDDQTHRVAAGVHGWNAQQGFYVYRNERMLVAGDWLGLGFQKEEHYKLARIRIDLPNSMDAEWQLDVKKSRAKPPGFLRADLKRIALLTRQIAAEIYRHRGKVLARQNSESYVFLWEQKLRHGKIFYSINREHPLVRHALDKGGKEHVSALLSMLEESIPSAHIVVTNAENPEMLSAPFENAPPEALIKVLECTFTALRNTGLSSSEAAKRVSVMDPFNLYPDFLTKFLAKTPKDNA